MQLVQDSASEGIALKDAGVKKVLSNNDAWADAAFEVVKALPVGWTGTGEDIRNKVGALPSHPNAWGGLINRALKADLIFPTGEYTAMKNKNSHGRRTPVYERM